MKDVKIPDNPATKTILLAKHADYIEAFEKNKDDYVGHAPPSQPSWSLSPTHILSLLIFFCFSSSLLPSVSFAIH